MNAPLDTSSLVECPESAEGFRDWMRSHPDGFVINAYREPAGIADNAMMWHQANCDHIDPTWTSAEPPFAYVGRRMLKACSTDPVALAIWAKGRSEPLTYCKDCCHRWRKG